MAKTRSGPSQIRSPRQREAELDARNAARWASGILDFPGDDQSPKSNSRFHAPDLVTAVLQRFGVAIQILEKSQAVFSVPFLQLLATFGDEFLNGNLIDVGNDGAIGMYEVIEGDFMKRDAGTVNFLTRSEER